MHADSQFGVDSGRDAAIDEADQYYNEASRFIGTMWAMPAQTNAGRAAKLRVFFKHVAPDHFKGPDNVDGGQSRCDPRGYAEFMSTRPNLL